ncbi:MAG TPA: site-2 protease family protein [Ktedonobacteraceae bacterium]|jgi:Zn-dependent protease/CBS domain-containing protein|nr:site-2 protease family protein [Ktedonobacteraceae bacterium]
MPGSLRIGQIAGIDIYINISWIIILVFQTWSLAISWFPAIYPHWSPVTYWITGLIAALLLFVSVLLHELAHSVVARARDLPVHNITLFIFGGVSNIEQEPASAGIEFQMAIVGPVVSILIGIVCYLLLLPLRETSSPVAGILGYLAITNVLLGIFNLIPGFPLDGGRVLRSIIWRITGSLGRATRAATITGEIVAYLFILAGIWLFFTGDFIGGIWIGFIGWFLMSSARSANSQVMLQSMLRGVKVSEVMNPAPATVPANISLQKLVYEHFLPQGLRSALVIQGDRLAGLITLSDIRHVPQEQWAQTPVGFAMIPRDRLHVVYPQQNLNDVLPLMANQDVNQLPVVQDERVVGVLSRDSIMRFLEIRRNLGIYSSRQAA